MREPGRTRNLSVVEGVYRCDGCRRWRKEPTRDVTGFCCHCITRQKRWWRDQMPLPDLLELAAQAFPGERKKRPEIAA